MASEHEYSGESTSSTGAIYPGFFLAGRRLALTLEKVFPALPRILIVLAIECGLSGLAMAAGSNALDRIDFGNANSEQAHAFDAGFSSLPYAGTGALGQTFRQPLGGSLTNALTSPLPNNAELVCTMTVDPVKQNYLTVRLWGSDNNGAEVELQQALYNLAPLDLGASPPAFPNRFYYSTTPIALSYTQGQTSIQLVLYESSVTGTNGRPIYSAYTHTDPHFIPDGSDPTGSQMTLVGQLPTTSALTLSQVISLLEANREAIYGSGGYYNSILARQVTSTTSGAAGSSAAPPEVIGQDMRTEAVADFTGTTDDEWRDACAKGGGPGYSTIPDEMLSVLTATYLLPPFTDANGNVVSGLDHYHDSTIITRIVQCLDSTSYLQSTDGHYQGQPYSCWEGLTSSPRAAGHDYAGLTTRGEGWSLSLEGADTDCTGRTILALLNDPTAAPLFENYLSQSYDADLNGGSMLRANAYERMLNNQVNYTYSIFGIGTVSQGMFSTNATYINTVALEALQALYPYNVTNTNFPASTIYPGSTYTFPYPDVSPSTGVSLLEQITGAALASPLMTGVYTTVGPSYVISAAGFGEAHGSLSGGYDGRYGTILPWIAGNLATFAGFDSNASGTPLSLVKTQARNTVNAYLHFISPEENFNGLTDNFTLAQEDYITYRDPYSPNADCEVFNVGSGYPAADPNLGINSALELRGAYLEAIYGITPGNTIGFGNKGGGNSLCYLETLGSYENTLRSLVNVNPSTLTMLPGEPGAGNSAFIDPQTGATAIYYNGERLYMANNWRNWEFDGNTYGIASNISIVHDTTSTVDQDAELMLPHDNTTVQSDGNLSGGVFQTWVMRYGNWLVAGNPTSAASTVTLPAGTGQALDLVANASYNMGSTVTVPAGGSVALNMPVSTTAQLISNGAYVLTNIYSQLLLDCPGGAATNGLQMDQASAPSSVNSQWLFTYTGSGFYTVKNVASGLFLTSAAAQGGALVQKPADSAQDQSWQLIQSGDSYVLVNQASGLAVEDPGNSTSAGTGMVLSAQDTLASSRWAFQDVSSTQIFANGTYTLTSLSSFLLADNIGSSQTSGQVIEQQVANGGTDQQWIFTYTSNGFYTIQNAASGLYLTPAGVVGNFSNPYLEQQTAITQTTGSPNYTWQLWKLVPSDAGYWFVNEGTGNVFNNQYSGPATTIAMNVWEGGAQYTWEILPAGVAAPSAPSGVKVAGADGSATLTWNASAGATGYDVLRSTTSGSGYTAIAYNVTGTSYTDSSVTDGTTYYYEVTAVDSGGQSAASPQVTAVPIAAPADLAAAGNNASVVLTWTSPTGATSFNVQRSAITGGPYTTVATGVSGTTYTDATATNGTTFYYVVSAADGVGVSANSNEAQAIPGVIAALLNAGFETPSVGTYAYNPSGASWTFVAQSGSTGSGISANGSAFTGSNPVAPQGVQVGFVQGTGSFSQTMTGLAVGTTYNVSFEAAQRANGNNGGQTWNVTANSATLASYAPPQSATSYIGYNAQFTASATSEPLAFVGTSGSDNTIFIDNVSLSVLGVPVITTALSAAGTNGQAFSYALAASNTPTSYAATGLPGGLSINTTTGVISGTPSATGTFNVTVSATNTIGTGTATLAITISPVIIVPAITSPTTASGSIGTAFSYLITASNSPTSFAATDLYPPGLTINTSTGLISGTPNSPGTYTSTLGASNSAGTGSATLTLTIYAVPQPPTGVTGTPGYSQTTLVWSSVANSTSYNVKRATNSGGPYTTVGTATNTSFVDVNVTNGTPYYYVVTAVNLAGESTSSSQVSLTPAAQAAAVPANVTAVPSDDNVTITWALANYATTYNVKRATASGGPYTTLASGQTAGNYTDTGVPASAAGITYYYAVSSVNPLGESANSSPATVTVLSVPSVPTGVGLSATGDTQDTISWNAATSASSYTVLRSTTKGGPYTIVGANVAATSYADSGLTPGSNYYYVIEANNAQGTGANSVEVELVDGLFDMTGFNPSTDLLTLGQAGILEIDNSTGTYAKSVVRASALTVNGGQGFSTGSTSYEAANFLDIGSSAGSTNDSFGPLTLSSGALFGKLSPNTAANEVVTFASLARNPGTELIFGHSSNFGLGVGSHTLALATANSANVVFTSAPTSLMIGGTGLAGTSTFKILPFAFVNSQLATYDTTSGLRPLASTETTTTLTSGVSTTANVKVSSHKTVSAATTVNAVYLTSGGSITGTGALTITSGALVADQSDTVSVSTLAFGSAEGLLYVGDSRILTISSVITGSNSLTACLEDYGSTSAELVLGGSNTFTGTTTLEGNNASLEVVLTSGLALQKSTLDYNNYGASLQFGSGSTNVTTATFGGLKGLQNLALTNAGTGGGGVALTVGGAGNSTSYGGILSGTGSLIKTGAGTLTLTGASSYSGATTINAGTLLLNGSLGSSSAVLVNSGATLGGAGTVEDAVTVASGGLLAPGSAIGVAGTLTVSNGLTLQGGSTLDLDLGAPAASDEIVMAGAYTGPTSGTVSLNFNPLAGFGVGTYHLITGATGINAGSFAVGSLPSGYNYTLTASNGTLSLLVSAPLPPTGLTAAASDGQVVLNWNASAGASSYTLSRSTVSGGPYTAIASGLTATTYTDTGLTDGTTYYYVVQGANLGGPGPYSSQVSATPLSPFQQWLVANNLPLNTPVTATPDHDGVAVLVKYATGLPVGTPAVNPVTGEMSGMSLLLQFNRLSPATVTYIVESSSDLVTWATVTSLSSGATSWSNPALVSETGTGGLRQVTVTDPSSASCLFLRLRVTTP